MMSFVIRDWRSALAATVLVSTASGAADLDTAYRSVDPFIGTQGTGHVFPGAVVPFGMVQLSPDTQTRYFKESYPWAAGYQYGDPTILGFSHTHFSGAGHSDLGDVLVTPIAGDVRLEPGDVKQPLSGYRSRFSHDTERAEPGYYAVTLADYDTRAELTATARVGLHRYTFPAGKPAHVLVDLRSSIYDYPGKVLWSRIRVRPDGTVTGYRETRGWAPGRQLYFAMRFSQKLTGHALYNREPKPEYAPGFASWSGRNDVELREGRGLVAAFDFDVPQSRQILVKVAISPVSEANAIRNLESEVPEWDFDAKRSAAAAAWREALAVLDVEAAEPMRKMLYTSLYHALHGAEFVHGCRRLLARPRPGGASGSRFHVSFHVLAVGHLSSSASAADAVAPRVAQPGLCTLPACVLEGESGWVAAGVAIPWPGNLDHDRLSRGSGDCGCVPQGDSRLLSR